MSSEFLASGENVLDSNLGGAWDIINGYAGRKRDLGVARRFGGAAAAYSLRDIGAMNGRVVKARREPHDGSTTSVNDEEDFSASQVQSGVLEDWVNGKLESTLPAENSPQLAVQVVIEHSDINSGASTTLKFFPQTTYTTRTPTVDGITYSIRDIIYRTYPLNVAGSFQLYADGNARWKINAFNTSTSSYDDAICHLKTTDPDRRTFNYSGGTSGLTFTQAVTRTPIDFPTTSDWVTDSGTGTLTSIAITSVSPAAAAYSLRKVNSSYSGNAVRIRRSSDDVEVDVAFDSDNKVSASSAITNVSEEGGEIGSTTATTLNGFLNEILTVGVAVEGGSSASNRPDSFSNATNSSFTATVTATAGGYFPYKTGAGDVITISFDLVLSGAASPSACTSTSVNTVNNASNSILYTASGSYTSSFTCTADATHFRFADGDDGTFAVTNFQVTSHTHQAFVHTWYDQAGSNNATQATDANQPKIAESGALLSDGLDFDGSNDFLESTTLSSIYTGTDTVSSAFVVVNSDVASTTQYIIGAGSTSNDNQFYNTLFHSGNTLGWQARDDANTLKSVLDATPYVADNMYLVSNINSGTTTDFNSNAVIASNGVDSDVGVKTINTVKLGARGNASTNPLNGSIKEAIFYASDQSANRFKIESNINNYYGLYNDANDLSSTSFTVSGGTLSGSNTTDGFTCTTTTSSEVRANFKNPIPSLSSNSFTFHMSFNADIANPAGSSGNGSPIVRLLNSSEAVTTAAHTVTQGFNSFSNVVNQNAGTDSTILEFFDNDANTSYSISDIKISLIARNGFVERLYDQSGNGRDMAQTTASDQPHIVENGGICKDPSGNNPTVKFVNVGTNLGSTFMTATPISGGQNPFTHLLVASSTNTGASGQTFVGCADGVDLRLSTLDMRMRSGNTNRTTSSNTLTSNTNSLLTYIRASGRVPKMALNNNALEVESAAPDAGSDNLNEILGENSTSASSDSFGLVGTISESILYTSDKNSESELSNLKTDIDNHYNIF